MQQIINPGKQCCQTGNKNITANTKSVSTKLSSPVGTYVRTVNYAVS